MRRSSDLISNSNNPSSSSTSIALRNPRIKRVIIFGDSMSDIGRMLQERSLPGGVSGVSRTGRFSDGRNWVDYLWQHMIGFKRDGEMFVDGNRKQTRKNSKKHMHLSRDAVAVNRLGESCQLVCYAEGGAVANPSKKGISWGNSIARKMLACLDEEVDLYLKERSSDGFTFRDEETLHIFWIGANDLVTVNCSTSSIPQVSQSIVTQAMRVLKAVPKSKVMIINLPDLQYASRFVGEKASKRSDLSMRTDIFNTNLEKEIGWANHSLGSDVIKLYKVSDFLTPREMGNQGFDPFGHQVTSTREKKKKPYLDVGSLGKKDYIESVSLLDYEDIGLSEESKLAYTFDQLHPTEAAYKALFEFICDFIELHFEIKGW